MKVSLAMPGEWRSSTAAAAGPCSASSARSGRGVKRGDALQLLGDIGEVAFLGAGIDDEIERPPRRPGART